MFSTRGGAVVGFVIVCFTLGCGPTSTTQIDQYETGAFLEDGIRATDKKPDQVTKAARKFFSEWLRDHGEENVVNDRSGVGVAENKTRLWAFHYGDEESTEVEFRIVLPDGREIEEFLSGLGVEDENPTQATFLNFCMSTFHVVYSCFMNTDDEHMEHEDITIGDQDFLLTSGGIFALGSDDLPQFDGMVDLVHEELKYSDLELTPQAHWLKVVYGQNNGEVIVCSVTLDNEIAEKLTKNVENLEWPEIDGFYMAKEFIVLRPKE